MKINPTLRLRAGPAALTHIRKNGLTPRDIACIPAAAGGPKGLTLLPLDRLLHSEWLSDASDLELIGASIGAWRVTALAQPDPLPALDRLQRAYVHEQNYTARPGPDEVATVCRDIVAATLGETPLTVRQGISLSIITARARGALAASESRLAFARAVLSNSVSRDRLAAHLQRVVFHSGDASRLTDRFDPFGLEAVALTASNERDALLASGTIPLLCRPVRDIAGAPPGNYWDGALVDYHLVLPYQQVTRSDRRQRIVFYPHFNDYMTQGWLDKYLPWRKAARAHPWLDDLLLVTPSPEFVSSLPNGKLPDRQDFYHYGPDHRSRARDWERAIKECERFAEAVINWMDNPDPTTIEPI